MYVCIYIYISYIRICHNNNNNNNNDNGNSHNDDNNNNKYYYDCYYHYYHKSKLPPGPLLIQDNIMFMKNTNKLPGAFALLLQAPVELPLHVSPHLLRAGGQHYYHYRYHY